MTRHLHDLRPAQGILTGVLWGILIYLALYDLWIWIH